MTSPHPYPAKHSNFKNISVLLVEDNPDHLNLIETTLQECMPGIQAATAVDRPEALHYLASEWQKKGKSTPKLILLDLYLPTREEGLRALAEIRAYFESRDQPPIPIVVFSYSDRPEDIKDCYAFGANAYLVKSPNYQAWKEYFEGIRNFWLEIVSLPMHQA